MGGGSSPRHPSPIGFSERGADRMSRCVPCGRRAFRCLFGDSGLRRNWASAESDRHRECRDRLEWRQTGLHRPGAVLDRGQGVLRLNTDVHKLWGKSVGRSTLQSAANREPGFSEVFAYQSEGLLSSDSRPSRAVAAARHYGPCACWPRCTFQSLVVPRVSSSVYPGTMRTGR